MITSINLDVLDICTRHKNSHEGFNGNPGRNPYRRCSASSSNMTAGRSDENQTRPHVPLQGDDCNPLVAKRTNAQRACTYTHNRYNNMSGRQTDRHAVRKTERQKNIQIDTDKHTDRYPISQLDKKTETQTHRKTYRQTNTR